MGKKINFMDLFQPGDLLAVAVVIAGVLIAVLIGDIAMKLIGVSVAILGGLALVMLVSQRLSEVVESNKFNLPKPNDFKMTVVKDNSATRQTVENFDVSFDSKSDLNKELQATMGADEGFRIVSKSSRTATGKSDDAASNKPAESAAIPAVESEKIAKPESIIESSIDAKSKQDIPAKDKTIAEEDTKAIDKIEVENIIEKEEPAIGATESDFPAIQDLTIAQEIAADPVEKIVVEDKIEEEFIVEPIHIEEKEITTIVEEKLAEPEYKNVSAKIPESKITFGFQESLKGETIAHEPIIENDSIPAEETVYAPELAIQSDVLFKIEEEAVINAIDAINDNAIVAETNKAIDEAIPEEVKKIPDETIYQEIKNEIEKSEPVKTDEPEAEKLPCKKKQMEVPFSLLMDDEPNLGKEPRKEFEFFVSRILLIIRSVIKTRTASLILVNADHTQLILETYITSIPDAITSDIKIPMGEDVVSQIVKNAKPEILTEINPSAELELIPYYTQSTGTSSFIGLPVFYDNQVVGIIACDTNEKQAYDASTVSFLGHFSKLISGLVLSYTEKYDLLQAEKTLNAINQFNSFSEQSEGSMSDIGKTLANVVSGMYDIQTVGVCLFDFDRNSWNILAYNSEGDCPKYLQNEAVDLANTLLGDVIINSSQIAEMPIVSNKPRVNKKEKTLPGGYFIAVPIKSHLNTYGALFLEGSNYTSLNNIEIEILQALSQSAGLNIEKLNLLNMIQTGSMIDPETGLMNGIAFFRRLQEEIARVRDYKSAATLCLISVDKYSAFESEDNEDYTERINQHCINLVKKQLHEYDVFGKVDTSVFATILIGQSADKTRIWAERIRNSSAISVVEIEHRRFTITLSIGITQISPADEINMLLENCSKVLNIAANKTNSVQIYQ